MSTLKERSLVRSKLTGQGKAPEALAKQMATWENKRKAAGRENERTNGSAAMYLREGDMVVDRSDGTIGVLTELISRHSRCKIMASNNIEVNDRSWKNIWQTTPQEITNAGLDGVRCNPYRGRSS